MSDSLLTGLTALYAALVATGNVLWTIYRDRNDVGKLKVSVSFRTMVGNGETEDDILVWNVTNTGRRSVLLTHVCVETPNTDKSAESTRNFLVMDHDLPRRLEPGDYHMSLCKEFDFGEIPTKLFVSDSLNRSFYAPKDQVREVGENMKKLWDQGITTSSKHRKRQVL